MLIVSSTARVLRIAGNSGNRGLLAAYDLAQRGTKLARSRFIELREHRQ